MLRGFRHSRNNRFTLVRRSSRGSIMVEGALCSLIFLSVTLGIMEFMRLGFTWLTLHYAVGRGVRFASLVEPSLDRGAEIRSRIRTAALMDIPNSAIRICTVPTTGCTGNEPGDPGDTVEIQVQMTFNGVGGIFAVPLSATAVVTNEPYEIQ